MLFLPKCLCSFSSLQETKNIHSDAKSPSVLCVFFLEARNIACVLQEHELLILQQAVELPTPAFDEPQLSFWNLDSANELKRVGVESGAFSTAPSQSQMQSPPNASLDFDYIIF